MINQLIPKVSNFVDKQLGISTQASKVNKAASLPWANLETAKNDPFFPKMEIIGGRWKGFFSYRLLVIDIATNSIVGGSDSLSGQITNSFNMNGPLDYVVTQTRAGNAWEFIFPISPQNLAITESYAITTQSTMRGVVEEHNGSKFKMISINGTTGIWPRRPTKAGQLKTPSIIGGLLPSSLKAVGGLASQIQSTANAFSGNVNKSKAEGPEDNDLTDTGYYNLLFLEQFLEQYAQAKKDPSKKNWRLVFDMPKENQSFVVTPVQFSRQKNQNKPHEYTFGLQLKAWKRVELDGEVVFSEPSAFNLSDTNFLNKALNTIKGVRQTLGAAQNLVASVRSDFRRPFEILRQMSLAVKDLGGFAFSIADLPGDLIKDASDSIKQSAFILRNSFKRNTLERPGNSGTTTIASAFSKTDPNSNAANLLAASVQRNEGLSNSQVTSGSLGSGAMQLNQIDPLNEVFENPILYFGFFDAVSLDSLNLNIEQERAVADELERVRLLNIDDFRQFREELLTLSLDLSNTFGAGDSTYASVFSRPDPKDRVIPMTLEENEIIESVYEVIQIFDVLTSTNLYDSNKNESPLEFVGGLATESGIDFDESSTSKYLVPVPFGLTLEQIAARYLGTPDKFVEIATLNNLTSPYIDEEGFFYDFLSNGDGRLFTVNDTNKNLFIGQKILILSDFVPQFSRKIINLEKLSDTVTLVTVDGEDNLDNLTTLQNARMQGYLPGTVNSQNQIYIPSNLPSDPDDHIDLPKQFQNDSLNKISKIDWLLDDNGDIAINGLGEFRLANGLNNLVQALKLKIKTKKGTLLRHLDFGIGIEHGISLADIENNQLFMELNAMIAQDSRFSGIERLNINIKGPVLSIDLAVKVANNSGIIPITFDV